MLWLLQQTLHLEGNFLPNFLEMMCPEVSMLLQYLQSEVTQIFCDFPTLPKLGFSGRLERTNKSRRRGLRLEPQTESAVVKGTCGVRGAQDRPIISHELADFFGFLHGVQE